MSRLTRGSGGRNTAPLIAPEAGLRVFMTADSVGGVWQYCLDLAQGLRAYGAETIIALLGPAASSSQEAAAKAAGAEIITTGLPLEWMACSQADVEDAGYAIGRLAEALKPGIVHLNSPALGATADFACPTVAVCHSCVATWWRAVRRGELPEAFAWRADLVRRGYQASDRLLAPTDAFARMTAEAYSLPTAPVVVRNGRRLADTSHTHMGEPFAFTAGRLWDDGKNFLAIDRAAARLPIPVLAAGALEGPNGTRVTAHHARALGSLDDQEVARYLAAQPIFISAALYEPFGLAVLEAAQAGCALVLSDIPTFRELWDGAALFVPPGDDSAIAGAVEYLMRDADAWRGLETAAQQRAALYTVEAMSAGVVSAYRSLLPPGIIPSPLEGAAA